MKFSRRFNATLLSTTMLLVTVFSSSTAFAEDVSFDLLENTRTSDVTVENTCKLPDGRTATTVSFIADSSEGTHYVDIPASTNDDEGAMPRLWNQESFDFSSGNHWGGTRYFREGNYLGYEVSLTPIGTQSPDNQCVNVSLYTDDKSKRVGYGYSNTRSGGSLKADWISINNSQPYRFWYYSTSVSDRYPLRVTITYYTWN